MITSATGRLSMDMRVTAVLPALNEGENIFSLISELREHALHQIIVVDNGSTDDTAAQAARAGAVVVREPQRGYGAAMLAGFAAATEGGADVIVSLDADGSDDPSELPTMLAALTPEIDMVLGVRDPIRAEAGSLTLQQRMGNRLATFLMATLLGARYSDLPPFKVIRVRTLEELELDDRGHGFTIQLLLRAHRRLKYVEIPVRCRRRRGGDSKVSGTITGTLRAGVKIITSILRHAAGHHRQAGRV